MDHNEETNPADQPPMNQTAFFAVLIVLILGIAYVLKTSDNPPATGMTQTPKEYIEYVERMTATKRTAVQTQETLQESGKHGDGGSDQR